MVESDHLVQSEVEDIILKEYLKSSFNIGSVESYLDTKQKELLDKINK